MLATLRREGWAVWVSDRAVKDRFGRPVIAGIGKPTVQGPVFHYEVVIGFHPETRRVLMLDPAEGWLQNSFAGFIEEWQAAGRVLLVVMPLPAPLVDR
jgi:hypothetical protein